MKLWGRASARTGVACAAAALAVAGCSSSGGASTSSSIDASGHTLSIYLSEPANISSNPVAQDIVDAERLAFAQSSGEVTAFHLALRTVADRLLSDNARAAIQDGSAIAYLGELAPGASEQTVGITNALDLLELSPTDTALELGSGSPVISGSPTHYFESWSTYGRTFARVVPSSAREAVFLVAQMVRLGVHSLYVASDDSDYGVAIAAEVKALAAHAGISASATESGAGAIFYGTAAPAAGARFFDAAASAAPAALLFGSSSLDSPAFLDSVSAAASHLYVSTPGLAPGSADAAATAFRSAFDQRYGHEPSGQAIFGYAAMEALLSVIKQAGTSANERETVVRDFLALHQRPSVLGTFSIDGDGNTSIDAFVLSRVSDGQLVPVRTARQG